VEQDEKRMDIEECGNCKFYREEDYEDDDVSYGTSYGNCRRFPPKRIDATVSGFPMVVQDEWCGEFQKKFIFDDK